MTVNLRCYLTVTIEMGAYLKQDVARVNDDKGWSLWSLSAVACCLLVLAFTGKASSFFWDFHVYEKGLTCYSYSPNPYACASGDFPFVYPPIFLKTFSVIDFSTVFAFLVLASAAGILCVCVNLKSLISYHRLAPCVVLGFLIGGSGYASIQTGNISVFAHLLLVSLSYFLYKNRSIYALTPHAFAIIFFSAIKPYFLAYVLLYLFLPRRRLSAFVAVLLSVACIYIIQPAFYPQLWAGFEGAIYDQIIQHGDAGLTIFGVFSKLGMGKIGLALHIFLVLLVILASTILRYRHEQGSAQISSASELFYFLAILILLNPRLMSYDFSVFSVCLYLSMILSSQGIGWTGVFLRAFPFLTIAPLCLEGLFNIRVHSLTYYFLTTYILLAAAIASHWPLSVSSRKTPFPRSTSQK
ncbi:hypothetical protein M3I54_19765 [Paraburkholderia sp. CNPSo 3274]|uniref:hypothetical protein n=1 Tax=Paraburkholderia sp. CNPSo 3274 TaxID=2940932 RepID=UPI0020B8D50F|nr:hypothetical protein [Paraburkholderia sp. CNPSo 3274]MCP3709204.1 hypothetical protein [Paraburkholderia sp. CNPSo 3274]